MKDINSYKLTNYDYRLEIFKLNKEKEEIIAENKKIKNESEFYKAELNKVLNSSSWKLTSPLRKLKSIGKKEVIEKKNDVQKKRRT